MERKNVLDFTSNRGKTKVWTTQHTIHSISIRWTSSSNNWKQKKSSGNKKAIAGGCYGWC